MADEKGKARPVQERIAALFGRGNAFDPREPSGTSPSAIKHSDVAAALGFVAAEKGRIAALVLETHYGSTLAHERELLKAWEAVGCRQSRDHAGVVLARFGGALAIRQYAGFAQHNTTQYAEYAYLIFSRREALQDKVHDALDWLRDIHNSALPEFERVMREHRDERLRRRMDKAA